MRPVLQYQSLGGPEFGIAPTRPLDSAVRHVVCFRVIFHVFSVAFKSATKVVSTYSPILLPGN